MLRPRTLAALGTALAALGGALLVGLAPSAAAPAQATGPHMVLSPSSGPIGTVVQVTGNGDFGEDGNCQQLTHLDNYIVTRSVFLEVLPPLTWDTNSDFSATVTIPAVYTDGFSGNEGVPLAAGTVVTFDLNCPQGPITAEFTVTAATGSTTSTAPVTAPSTTVAPFTPPAEPPADAGPMASTPGPLPPGGTLVIDEGGFEPGETVHVVLYSQPEVLASVQADEEGVVATAIALPNDTAPGTHTLVLFGRAKVVKAPLTVTALPGQAPGATTATLPRTGPQATTGTSATAAAALLGAGATLVVLADRRRRRA